MRVLSAAVSEFLSRNPGRDSHGGSTRALESSSVLATAGSPNPTTAREMSALIRSTVVSPPIFSYAANVAGAPERMTNRSMGSPGHSWSRTVLHYGTRMESRWFFAVLIGIVAGFLSGLLGIGGGVVIVPAFVLLLKLNQYRAAATSVATIAVTAAAALVTFVVTATGDEQIDWSAATVVFAGSAVGVVIGARYLERIPEYVLAGVFSLLMAIGAVRMAL